MNEDEEINARLFHIQRQMNDELANMTHISQGLTQITENLESTTNKNSEFDGQVSKSKRKITLIEKYQKHQNFFFRLAFFLLLATVAYFVLKRFWLHQILDLFYSLLKGIASKFVSTDPSSKGATSEL